MKDGFDRLTACGEAGKTKNEGKTAIVALREEHRDEVIAMMRGFYASDAVFTNGSEEIFAADVDACVGDNPYLEGYVFKSGGRTVGYGMLAKSFSTEFGKPCVWIEDIFVKSEARGCGVGTEFINFVSRKYDGCVLRLEVEEENERAVAVYRKCGFYDLPYKEMKK